MHNKTSSESQTHTAVEHARCILSPGYLAVSDTPSLLCSVCGNGVVVTLWDPVKKHGGMAHCIFSKPKRSEKPTNYHASIAIPSLVKQLLDLNPEACRFEAQLFGGGSGNGEHRKKAHGVITVIRKTFKKVRVTVVSEDIGGMIGRKIVFDTHSGDVLVIRTKKVRTSDWLPEHLVSA